MPRMNFEDEEADDESIGFEEQQAVPLSLITPEHRCACRESFIDQLHDLGLTDDQIDDFINFAHNPEKEIKR